MTYHMSTEIAKLLKNIRFPISLPVEEFEIKNRDLTIPKFLRRDPNAPHWKDYDKGSD
jgi:hypothetical protein